MEKDPENYTYKVEKAYIDQLKCKIFFEQNNNKLNYYSWN